MMSLKLAASRRTPSLMVAMPLALALAASPALAQKTGSTGEAVNRPVASGPASGASASGAAESETDRLNREQAAAAEAQNAANASSANTFNAATADYQAARTAAADAQARYEREMQAHRDAQAAYDTARARWQADVQACQAGDFSRCASPTTGSGPTAD